MHRREFATRLVALGVGGATLGTAGAANDEAPAQHRLDHQRRTMMGNINERVVNYIAAWNEKDGKRRREIIGSTWVDNGSYVDAHRHAQGHAEIDKTIDSAQQQFPGYSLRLVSGIEAHNSFLRFSWAAGGSDRAPLYLGGTDFAVVAADGRFQSVVGFVDAAPAR